MSFSKQGKGWDKRPPSDVKRFQRFQKPTHKDAQFWFWGFEWITFCASDLCSGDALVIRIVCLGYSIVYLITTFHLRCFNCSRTAVYQGIMLWLTAYTCIKTGVWCLAHGKVIIIQRSVRLGWMQRLGGVRYIFKTQLMFKQISHSICWEVNVCRTRTKLSCLKWVNKAYRFYRSSIILGYK